MRRPWALAGFALGVILLTLATLQLAGRSAELAFAGDVMLGRGVAQGNAQSGWGHALAALASCTASSDLTFANLESPLTALPLVKETYDLRAEPDAVAALLAGGIDVLSLANNHTLDAGVEGLQDTLRNLHAAGLQAVDPQNQPWLVKVRGLRVALLALDDTTQTLDLGEAVSQVKATRPSVDLLLISIHWGHEGDTFPSIRQERLAQALADAGADIIIGHHPHALQPVQWIKGSGRPQRTLVAYSLGNTLFDQSAPPAARYAALLLVSVGPHGALGACAVPFQLDPRTWSLAPAGLEAQQAIARSLQWPCILSTGCANGQRR